MWFSGPFHRVFHLCLRVLKVCPSSQQCCIKSLDLFSIFFLEGLKYSPHSSNVTASLHHIFCIKRLFIVYTRIEDQVCNSFFSANLFTTLKNRAHIFWFI